MNSRIRNVLASILIIGSIVMTSCSSKLPDETLPSVTEAVPTETEVVETEIVEIQTEETEPTIGPNSTAQVTERPVDINGQLSVSGTNLVNENGEVVQLRGMSSCGLIYQYNFFTDAICDTLVQDWGCSVVRLAMTTRGYDMGYVFDPDRFFDEVCTYADRLIERGCYVILDWHILYDGDPNENKELAIDFFSRMSAIYGDCPNVIYEVCNEPNGTRFDDESANVDWDNVIRPYALDVISAIRANDPDNIIIVGTPSWSQNVDEASLNPIDDPNVMYTLHFYAGSHGQELRDRAQTAIDNGLPLFVTEWGTSLDSGSGGVFYDETIEWLDFLDNNSISWCNWCIGGSNTESSNALRLYSNNFTMEQKLFGHWPDEMLSDSGLFVRSLILGQEPVIRVED